MDSKTSPIALVGLGNPGKRYARTRHNLGAMVVEKFVELYGWSFQQDTYLNSLVAKGKMLDHRMFCLLPQTYMNESGWSVKRFVDYYTITPAHVIVVSDDVNLDFGQFRIRPQGSPGGHNGLKSLETYLGTNEFIRLRMGVGSKGLDQTLADYVLSNFNQIENVALDEFILSGVRELEKLLSN